MLPKCVTSLLGLCVLRVDVSLSSGCFCPTLSCHRQLNLYPKFLHISHRENGSSECCLYTSVHWISKEPMFFKKPIELYALERAATHTMCLMSLAGDSEIGPKATVHTDRTEVRIGKESKAFSSDKKDFGREKISSVLGVYDTLTKNVPTDMVDKHLRKSCNGFPVETSEG